MNATSNVIPISGNFTTPKDIPARVERARLLQMHFEAKTGHIGGNLSVLDALLVLHRHVITDDDRFVLSKGHAAGALYISLWAIGELAECELNTFHKDNTRLAGHPVANWHKRISFSTGSLGHGLGLSVGIALAKQLRAEPGRVYCMLSDGECEEGSIWEALIFARHRKLRNLVILVDANGLQGFGDTNSVASMEPLAAKFAGFGLEVEEIDGHSHAALETHLRRPRTAPVVIILRTIKGKGVSFMEGRMEWHYLQLNQSLLEAALAELNPP